VQVLCPPLYGATKSGWIEASVGNPSLPNIGDTVWLNLENDDPALPVWRTELADASITTAKLADASVTLAKMAANSVDSSKIVAKSIVAGDIADDTITATQIAPAAVGNSELGIAAVKTANLDSSVYHRDNYTGTLDGSSNLTVTHGAGFTPTAVFLQTTSPSGGANQGYPVLTAIAATTFTLRYLNSAGAMAGQSVAGWYICWP
jgi:hypothetical protein